MLTFPLAFLFVLMFGYKYVKNMNYVEVEAKLNTDSRKRFGFKVYIPLLLAIVLMVLNKAVPAIPDIGMPLVFLISAVVGCFTGYKFNFFKAAKESVHSALPVMGILMGVGMFIQVMTLTGVRGLIVTSCLSLPSFARYLALAISMPAFGAISSFGSASVLGVPFLLSFLAKDQIIVAAALSLVASLGDMVPHGSCGHFCGKGRRHGELYADSEEVPDPLPHRGDLGHPLHCLCRSAQFSDAVLRWEGAN
ncbi:MAG: hypothetical protein ACLSHJ_04350 [Oscillospiraceae bacterium]